MKYMGSKARISKDIVPILQKCIDTVHAHFYIEPFVGGANIIDKINCDFKFGCDNNSYLIALLQHVQDGGELPIDISRETFNDVKKNKDKYEPWFVGCCSYLASYCARGFSGGYARPNERTARNFYQEAKRNLEKQASSLLPKKRGITDKGLQFVCCDYKDIPTGLFNDKVIYCDPPYANAKKYDNNNFNSEEFWDWVRKMSLLGFFIFVSEREAPDDFECIWEGKVKQELNHTKRTDYSSEKLFVWKNGAVADLINKGIL